VPVEPLQQAILIAFLKLLGYVVTGIGILLGATAPRLA
jgi:hypothetical protein